MGCDECNTCYGPNGNGTDPGTNNYYEDNDGDGKGNNVAVPLCPAVGDPDAGYVLNSDDPDDNCNNEQYDATCGFCTDTDGSGTDQAYTGLYDCKGNCAVSYTHLTLPTKA